jgi:hypothetical protein
MLLLLMMMLLMMLLLLLRIQALHTKDAPHCTDNLVPGSTSNSATVSIYEGNKFCI